MPDQATDVRLIECRGLKFMARAGTTDEKVIDEVVKRREYTKGQEIEPGEHWADLGGNIGTFTVLAAHAGAKVRAYEPEPSNFGMWKENVRLNRIHTSVQGIQAAVQWNPKRKSMPMYLSKGRNHYRHTIARKIKGREKILVKVEPFEKAVRSCDCVKMDIEGSELPMLDHADWSFCRRLVFEYHFDVDRSIPAFNGRMERLSQWFGSISYGKMPNRLTYDFFPAARTVICSK